MERRPPTGSERVLAQTLSSEATNALEPAPLAPEAVSATTQAPPSPAEPAPADDGGTDATAHVAAGDIRTTTEPPLGQDPSPVRALALGVVVLAVLAAGLWFVNRRADLFPTIAFSFVGPPRQAASPRGRFRTVARQAAWVLVALVLSAMLVQVGKLALYRPGLAVVVASGILACVLMATDPLALATVAVLGVWVIERVSAGGIDISGSDTLLVMGAIGALPFVPWGNQGVRRVMTAIVACEAVLFVTVLAHPSARGLFEWGHRLFLTGGAVVVGAALAHHGRTRAVLRALLIVATVVGTMAVLVSASRGFAPAELLGYHKNFIGSMLLVSLVVSYLTPGLTGFSSVELAVVKAMSTAGLLASQSRGAIIALLVALVAASLHSAAVRRRSAALFLVLVPLAVFAFVSLRSQVDQPPETVSSSVTERARYRDQGLEAWRASPAFGQGMRFFETDEFDLNTDPHNVVVASLAETGIVGLAALTCLLGYTVGVTRRLGTALGMLALTVLVARFTHGLFDIYWVAGTQSLPWVIVGMALGDRAVEEGSPAVAEALHEPVRSPADA